MKDTRKFEVGLFELGTTPTENVAALEVPTTAVLYQIIVVDNKPYAVFVQREVFEEELSG